MTQRFRHSPGASRSRPSARAGVVEKRGYGGRGLSLLGPKPEQAASRSIATTDAYVGGVHRLDVETPRERVVRLFIQRSVQTVPPCAPVRSINDDDWPFHRTSMEPIDSDVTIADLVAIDARGENPQ